ncbi:MAG: dihydroorotase family protein [Acidobacteriota bacterium]
MVEREGDLVIRGNVVQSGGRWFRGEVVVKGGRIAAVGEGTSGWTAKRTLKADGSWILPGIVDGHVHCLSDPSEGIANCTRAAAAGGVTTIVEMPFDAGAPVNHVETFRRKRERVETEALVDVALLATIRKTGGLGQIGPLAHAGACGFKLSLFETDPERFPQVPDGELLEAFKLIAETGLVVGVHAENTEIVNGYITRLREGGRKDAIAHCESRPPVSETEATLRALEFARWAGVRLHIFHVSLSRCIELASWFRSQGSDVTTETCPHYLLLNEKDMERLGARVKINPPLRSAEESKKLWTLLGEGKIDLVTSDHAPWQSNRKDKPDIFENASGTPGVETLLPLLYSEGVVARGLPLQRLVEVLCEAPADRFGLAPRKGRLAVGADADIVVLNPEERWMIDEKKLSSSARWSPYHGMIVQGRVTEVFLRGRPVVEGGVLVGKPGVGQFLASQSGGDVRTTSVMDG